MTIFTLMRGVTTSLSDYLALKRGYTTGSRVTGISGQDTTFWTAVGKSAAALAAFLKQPRQLARPYSTPHAMIPVPKGGQIFCPSPGLPKALRVSKPVAITPPACPKHSAGVCIVDSSHQRSPTSEGTPFVEWSGDWFWPWITKTK